MPPQSSVPNEEFGTNEATLVRHSAFALLCLSLQAVYIGWRLLTLPHSWSIDAALTWVALAAEVALAVAWASLVWGVRQSLDRRLEAASKQGWWEAAGQTPPRIVILIPTYDEDALVLRRALAGATGQNYANYEVWVLDDGCRSWVNDLSQAYGCSYLERTSSSGAKAGNLNHAIRAISQRGSPPEYFAVIDADFILQSDFLRKTLALMYDTTVGLVQTPQSFFNLDPLQRAFPKARIADDMRFAFEISQPARDAYDAAFCCGTSFLVRAEALHAIDLFPTESVTEDLLTSVRMRGRGYRTVYLNEVLSHGLAPQSLRDFVNQRKRWSTGFLHLAGETLRGGPRAGLLRWLRTIEAFSRWSYTSAARLFLALVPVLYWFFGFSPIHGVGLGVALVFGATVLCQRLFIYRVSKGFHMPLLTDAAALLMAPHFLATALAVLMRRKDRFVVTAKGVLRTHTNVFWSSAGVLLPVFLLNIVGVVYGASKLGEPSLMDALVLVWSSVTVMVAGVGLLLCVEPPSRRIARRFDTSAAVSFVVDGTTREGRLSQMSESGAVFEWDGTEIAWPVRLAVKQVGEVTAHRVRSNGECSACVRFELDQQQHAAWVTHLYFACLAPIRDASFVSFLAGAGGRLLALLTVGLGSRRVEHEG